MSKAPSAPSWAVAEGSREHVFSLRGFGDRSNSKLNTEVLFAQQETDQVFPYPMLMPVKNHLINAFSQTSPYMAEPLFVVRSAIDFGLLKEQESEEKDEINVPRHTIPFCAVCKVPFEEYIEHVRLREHRDRVSKSRVSHYIRDLCSTFQKPKAHAHHKPSREERPHVEPRPRERQERQKEEARSTGFADFDQQQLLQDRERNDELLREDESK